MTTIEAHQQTIILLMSVPDDFKLDAEVSNAFWVLGYQSVNFPGDASDTEKMIRKLLHSMNIKSWDECYKIKVLGDHWVKENYRVAQPNTKLQNASNEAVAVVKMVCDYFGQMSTEPYTVPEKSDILAGRESERPTDRGHRGNAGRSENALRRIAVERLDQPASREQKRRSRRVRIITSYRGELIDEHQAEESTDDESCHENSRPSDFRRKWTKKRYSIVRASTGEVIVDHAPWLDTCEGSGEDEEYGHETGRRDTRRKRRRRTR